MLSRSYDMHSFLRFNNGGRDLSFTEMEIPTAEYVHALAKEEFEKRNKEGSFQANAVPPKEKLYKLVQLFKECENARIIFLGNFDIWQEIRENNILHLNQITGIITPKLCSNYNTNQTTAEECNYTDNTDPVSAWPGAESLVSSTVSILCSLKSKVPGFRDITLSGSKAKMNFLLSKLPVVGASTLGGALNKAVNEAREVCEQDRLFFDLINQWFEHAQDLACAMECIFGFNLMREIFEDIEKMYSYLESCNSSDYNNVVEGVVRKSVQNMCRSENITNQFEFTVAPIVITVILIRFLANGKKPHIFGCVLASLRSALSTVQQSEVPDVELTKSDQDAALAVAVVDFTRVFKAVSSLPKERESAPSNVLNCGRVAFRDGLFNFGIALDNALLILDSCDCSSINQESESEEAIGIKEVVNQLETELCILKELYAYLKK